MKQLTYLFLLHFICIQYTQAQCFQADATIWKDTWASCTKTANPNTDYSNSHWIQYNFDSVRNLSKTWVWNTNDPTQLTQGFKQVSIDYSEDGKSWTNWGQMDFPKATGAAIYSGFSGPDLQNIKAQYLLITALSNHGHATCAGLAEIKFNLLPPTDTTIPESDEEAEEEEDEESEIDICSLIEEIELDGFMEVEVAFNEAFVFIEIEEEILEEWPLFFEYRKEGANWESMAIESVEMVLENLEAGATYEYRIALTCGDEFNKSPSEFFQMRSCTRVGDISIEEITETEAYFLWPTTDLDYYLIELNVVGEEDIMEYETEESELFLEELNPSTDYEVRVGTECSEEIIWSEPLSFTTEFEISDVTTPISNKVELTTKQVHLFPNPTPGQLTIRIKTAVKDVLNYSISDVNGQILYRNVSKIHSGTNDLKLDVSNLPNGTYWLHGLTLNQRVGISEQIIKVGTN